MASRTPNKPVQFPHPWHETFLRGGAVLARSHPRSPDILRFAKTGQESTIRHDFQNILTLTTLAHKDLTKACEELSFNSDVNPGLAHFKRLEDVANAVRTRLHELKKVEEAEDVEAMKMVVVWSKARQLGLCTDRALERMIEGDDEVTE